MGVALTSLSCYGLGVVSGRKSSKHIDLNLVPTHLCKDESGKQEN